MITSLIGFAIVLVLAFLGIPLAFAILSVGVFGFVYLRGFEAALSMSSQWVVDSVTNYSFSVIPLFILMGGFIHHSGISRDLFGASYAWLGRFRGGLAMSGVVSCAGFSAVCGSSLATAATMTRVAVPSMREYRYNEGFSAGTIAAGGTLGIMIPPSVPMAIYGIIAGEDIGKLFIAGMLPGLMLIMLFLLAITLVTAFNPALGPAGRKLKLMEAVKASYATWPVIILFALVLGGIYSGITTPTEAAAIGAFGAWMLGAFKGHFLTLSELSNVFVETIKSTSMIFMIVIAALILNQFINMTGMPFQLVSLVTDLNLSPLGLVLVICIICLLMGMVFESLGILLLIIPVFLPSLSAVGVDLLWFGVIAILVIELGLISPPIGMNVFAVRAVASDIKLTHIFAGVTPYIAAMLIGLILLFLFPEIATWLPSAMR